jgi:hypothetical protein
LGNDLPFVSTKKSAKDDTEKNDLSHTRPDALARNGKRSALGSSIILPLLVVE